MHIAGYARPSHHVGGGGVREIVPLRSGCCGRDLDGWAVVVVLLVEVGAEGAALAGILGATLSSPIVAMLVKINGRLKEYKADHSLGQP